MPREQTPQQKGYAWDGELAKMIGGRRQKGSGNTVAQKLDAQGHSLIISGKYVDAASFSVKERDLDEMLEAVFGSGSTDPTLIPILAAKYKSGRTVAVMDLLQLLEWIRQPPSLVPTSAMDDLRATARTPSFLRGR